MTGEPQPEIVGGPRDGETVRWRGRVYVEAERGLGEEDFTLRTYDLRWVRVLKVFDGSTPDDKFMLSQVVPRYFLRESVHHDAN